VKVLATGLGNPEGPAVLPDGRIAFVETYLGRISTWDPADGVQPYGDVGGGPNACTLGLDGLYVTQTGGKAGPWRAAVQTTPCIQKVTEDGAVEVVVTEVDGVPLQAPNDLAFGPDGQLYFTDPGDYDPEDPDEGRVCVIDPDGRAAILVETGPVYPNGIAAEPDGSIVWTESYPARVRRRGPDGTVELVATLPDGRIPDGVKLDADGRLHVAAAGAGGIDVLAPDGEHLTFLATGGTPQNCVFDGRELYVTDFGEATPDTDEARAPAIGRLLALTLDVAGRPLYRGALR
jgi:gluconolactonase